MKITKDLKKHVINLMRKDQRNIKAVSSALGLNRDQILKIIREKKDD